MASQIMVDLYECDDKIIDDLDKIKETIQKEAFQ